MRLAYDSSSPAASSVPRILAPPVVNITGADDVALAVVLRRLCVLASTQACGHVDVRVREESHPATCFAFTHPERVEACME